MKPLKLLLLRFLYHVIPHRACTTTKALLALIGESSQLSTFRHMYRYRMLRGQFFFQCGQHHYEGGQDFLE